ncbi:DUF4190 domain-containing protein [Paractinoplanes durhamensis]|uniref:DUF4190 domain-containing protein n=1 Tax=Paractinoplanes durhamensis TaxID=113563 RepID=A0ABQ3YYJ3_9ACTN|nr:DUF4190 domain-containing protein [Actinoplanes durhamensis]GIE02645.1 hypothetical protein Adu01nite_39950 [Actinoplanes durhamensis]
MTDPFAPIPRPYQSEINGLAIASLILGAIACFPIGIALAIVALVQIHRTGQRGRGLAIAGLALGGFWAVVIAASTVAGVVLGVRNATRPDLPELRTFIVGQCLDDLNGDLDEVPCGQPHDGEVYSVFDLPAGRYPGVDAVMAQAESRCGGELGIYVQDFGLGQTYLYPPEDGWPKYRNVTCIAYDPNGPLVGSVRK